MAELTHKQRLFVEYYEGNGTDAARKAGYKGNDDTLRKVGSENLTKPDIAAAIKAKMQPRLEAIKYDRDWKRKILGEIAEATQAADRDRIRAIEVLCKVDGEFLEDPASEESPGFQFTE